MAQVQHNATFKIRFLRESKSSAAAPVTCTDGSALQINLVVGVQSAV